MLVHLERNQRIVFGLNEQSRYADTIQKLIGGLGCVVVVRGAESKGRRGETVVEVVNSLHSRQIGQLEKPGRQLLFELNALFQAADKPAGINIVRALVEPLHASRQVNGRRN